MPPPGAVFVVVSLTANRMPPFCSFSLNERSSVNQKALNLCGIAAIGDIFNSVGGLPLMVSHATTLAWFVLTYSLISCVKCSIASGVSAD